MPKTALFPMGSKASSSQIKVSPGLVSNGHVFLTGVTGSLADGVMPEDLEDQFRSAFAKIGSVLSEAGLGYGSIVDMTSFHVGLRDHFDLFNKVRSDYVEEPYATWTAVEISGLRREGAVVEIKIIAEVAANER